MTSRDQFMDDIGAYLLGALDPGEQRTLEAHLEGCEACREEVARLQIARDALPRSVDQVAPPERLKASLMETVRAEAPAPAAAPSSRARRSRRRRLLLTRPRYAAAAAAVVLAIGVAAGAAIGLLGDSGDGGGSRTVAAIVDQARMPAGTATLVVPEDADRKGGAILRVEGMQQPQEGHVYEVWIQRGSTVRPSSLFTVERDGSGAAAIPHELRDADTVLVTREPAGGSKRPSEPPVVHVRLPS